MRSVLSPDILLQKVIEQAHAANIPVSRRIDPVVLLNGRAKSRYGCCYYRNGRFYIEISKSLLICSETEIAETIAHEVLHTCPGCRNHQTLWKLYAKRMNELFGYNISRIGSYPIFPEKEAKAAKYTLKCKKCGTLITRTRLSKVIKNPSRYRCRCGGSLERV